MGRPDDNGLFVPQGVYTFSCGAVDRIGNKSAAGSFAVTLSDKTSLSITKATITPSRVTTRVSRLSIGYNLNYKAKITIRVEDAKGALVRTLANGAMNNPGDHTAAWDLKDKSGKYVPAGAYTIRITGDNGNGKGSAASVLTVTINVDNVKPKVKFQSSGTISYTNAGNPLSMGFTVSEKASSAALTIRNARGQTIYSSSMIQTMDKDTIYRFKWDGKDQSGVYQPTGTYYAEITARDLAGNTSATVKRKIRLTDKTAPVIEAPASVTYDYFTGQPVKVAFTLSEPATVTAKVYDFYGVYMFTLSGPQKMQSGKNAVTFTGRDQNKQVISLLIYPLTIKFTAADVSGNKAEIASTQIAPYDLGDGEN